MGALDWSPIPARNAITDPTIAARDGASAREYPSLTRGVMAGVAALALDQGGALVSTGTDNVYDVATTSGITKLQPGISIAFWADRDNTAEPVLNIDGTGPRRWTAADGSALPPGSVQGGHLYVVAWNAAVPGTLPAWRIVGGGAGGPGLPVAVDFSGAPEDRSQYDGAPGGKVFLAVADIPAGPTWTLYLKRSNGFGDWSAGYPLKASPAQSTAEAQEAAERAAAEAVGAERQRQGSEAARTGAQGAAALAGDRALAAAEASADARSALRQIGLQAYDFSADSASDPSNDWSN